MSADDVLRMIAQRLRNSTRPYDRVGRYGQEEFLVIAQFADVLGTMALAERIRANVESHPIRARARAIRLTLSLACRWGDHPRCVDAKTLLQLADDALYRAKENGRNRCELAAGTKYPDSVLEIGIRLVARP